MRQHLHPIRAEGRATQELEEALEAFFARDLIVDVIGWLKAGKEAQVFICEAHPATGKDLLAAKVYRPRLGRSFKKEVTYLEGRGDLMRGRARASSTARAIERRSRAGKALLEDLWVRREHDILSKLWQAGVRVPQPRSLAERALLMDYVGTEEAQAPRLQDVTLTAEAAGAIRDEILSFIEVILSQDLVHGDLSPYNVLIHDGSPWIIDVPQAIEAHVHPDPFPLLQRDVTRITHHFARYGIEDDGEGRAADMWHRYASGRL